MIFEACVQTKLLYSLHTTWLKKQELAKVDAFHARCLRRILGIGHSYWSRVTNASVLQLAGRMKLSSVLLQRQLCLFGQIARCAGGHPLRDAIFAPPPSSSSPSPSPGPSPPCILKKPPGVRKRGRPRQTWAGEVGRHAAAVCDDCGFPNENINVSQLTAGRQLCGGIARHASLS